MEIPATNSTSVPGNQEAKPSCWRSMALSLGSLLRWLRGAPPSPNVARYNPESTGVGVLSAVKDMRQRVLGPLVHNGARDIPEVALPSIVCGHDNGRPFRAAIISCGRCSRWIGHGAVYMYKGEIGFCKPECRYDYILDELHILEELHRQREKRPGHSPTMVDGDTSSIFFTSADIL